MLARSKRNADPQDGNAKRARPEEGEETRVLISNQVAGIIIGKKGAKVANIREQTGVSLTILNSETGAPTADRIMVIQGAAEDRAKALHLVAQLIADSESKQGEKLSNDIQLLIHKVHAGAIIGKQGATIKQIKTNTGAGIKISNDCLGESTEKACTISGTPDQIFDALILILEKISENPLREGTTYVHYLGGGQPSAATSSLTPAQVAQAAAAYAALAPGGAFANAGAYTQLAALLSAAYAGSASGALSGATAGEKRTDRVNIPTKMAGAVIGQGGSAIRSISAQSGCTISIADADPADPDVRTISVTGTAQGIQTALALIHQRVDSAGQAASASFGTYPSYSPFPLSTTLTQPSRGGAIGQPTFTKLVQPPVTDPSLIKTERVPIASNRAGALIGKQGSTMKQITALSGCAISIADPEETNPEERIITIKGTDLAVQYAIILIRQRLEMEAAAQTASAPAKMELSFPEETQTATLAIPTATAGAVIGKSGATIASIKQQSGCSISIADVVGDSSERLVTVTGTSQGIQTATNLIQQKVSSYVPKHA